MIDLVCLVADKNIEAVIEAVLQRPEALGIRRITSKLNVHPHRDSGCFDNPIPFLQPWRREAQHALVLLDRAWEGAPDMTTLELEADVNDRLHRSAPDWAKCVVIDPEVEAWLFRRSPRLDEKLGWQGKTPSLQDSLAANGMWPHEAAKPPDPKAAIEWALHKVQRPRSSATYREVGSVLGLRDCVDPSFHRFRTHLQTWYPVS